MPHRYRRLIPLVVLVLAAPLAAAQPGPAAQDVTLRAPDGGMVSIDRDTVGVPHIVAPTELGVFFGQGFAVAQDRLFQMETFWRTATGRFAELPPEFGGGLPAVPQDQGIRTVYYTEAERAAQFEDLSPRLQTMITAYVGGINAYIDSTAANPAVYLPFEYAAGGFAPERYTVTKTMAVMQFFIRRFGEIGGQELARLAELQAFQAELGDEAGLARFNELRPINDPTAPTTLKGGAAEAGEYGSYLGGGVDPAVAAAVEAERAALTASLIAHGVPHTFGSFAAVVSGPMTESGNVMLLGAPQMGLPAEDQKAVTSEVELLVGEPGGGGLHVAGMTVPGIPGVIIGRTRGRTWTFTTGFSDNTDTFALTLGPPTAQGVPTYVYDGAARPAQAFTETIRVRGGADVTYTHFRSVHGPVYSLDQANGQAYAYKYTFWQRELDMAEALLDAWDATSVEAFEAAVSRAPVSFNIFYADKEQNIAFWHVGDYPIRPAGADPRLPLQGDGTQEWTGLVPFVRQPQAVNPAQGYFANWNNKPAAGWDQGDNVPWTDTPPGGRLRPYDGVLFLEQHLEATSPVSFEDLQGLTRVVRTNAKYPEYPGTYQQVVEFSRFGSTAENVIPPGQSGFVNIARDTSAHFSDQWPLYESSLPGGGEILMKPFTFLGATAVPSEPAPPGAAFGIDAVYPNPSAARTTVAFSASGAARLDVFDALGRRVATLHDGPTRPGQTATLDTGALPAGVYLVRLQGEGGAATRTLVVAR
ncbi:penicillin acylase family protein [Rubrivirga sp. S365]|uniref:penicillin acylase family protein n=1 Tax=Rubrivirga sp. S365 TaxID=3076080 RepID=UPI0028C878E9|nr:penicillin acylase family protein [Rubrivirga sp. S365]MDT7855895.1 penicillin acylase family protein [Rubrivirga sp. S365]